MTLWCQLPQIFFGRGRRCSRDIHSLGEENAYVFSEPSRQMAGREGINLRAVDDEFILSPDPLRQPAGRRGTNIRAEDGFGDARERWAEMDDDGGVFPNCIIIAGLVFLFAGNIDPGTQQQVFFFFQNRRAAQVFK